MDKTINYKLFQEAKKYIPGGVNSPVRSFGAVGGYPIFVKQGKGSKFVAECEGEFVDYCMSWGALILGHSYPEVINSIKEATDKGTSFGAATKLEIELAKIIIEAVPSIELVRLTNSGTEAVMGAIRLARGYTKRDKIIKFEGSYHGNADYLLNCPGVPKDFTKHTISVPFNNIKSVEKAVKKYKKDLAAIIIEPIMANCGVVLPKNNFLQKLRDICDKNKVVLIFDEVITGFRISFGGAQRYFNVKPDLTCLGKIIGGGLPVGAFGGKKEIMQLLSPVGDVYQAGTLSGNPIAVSAGITTLNILKKEKPYKYLENLTQRLYKGIRNKAKEHKINLNINYIGSMFSVSLKDKELFKRFFHSLLKEGIYFSPSSSEANFLSTEHTEEDLEKTLRAVDKSIASLR